MEFTPKNRATVQNMPKLPYAGEKSCCTISVKNTWKKIVEIVTTV